MKEKLKNIAAEWDDAHLCSPAPRHRRRIILNIVKRLDFQSCLDAGCAQPYLLLVLASQGKEVYGCDISDAVIESNRKRFPGIMFEELDISRTKYPDNKRFGLVISSEVLEHLEDWRSAVRNLVEMASKYLLITVPGGRMRGIDKLIGHMRHYDGADLKDEIETHGLKVILFKRWGFPFHSAYKCLINLCGYEAVYRNFGSSRYGIFQKAIAQFLYYLFYLNDIFGIGEQICILARR